MKYKLILIALLFSGHMAAQPLCIPTVQEVKPAQGSASYWQTGVTICHFARQWHVI